MHTHNPLPPPHFPTRDNNNPTAIHHRNMQYLLIANQRLTEANESLSNRLTVAKEELRYLSDVADKVKTESEAQVGVVSEKKEKMEKEVGVVNESVGELVETLGYVRKLKLENDGYVEKLRKVKKDVVKVEGERRKFTAVKSDIENMKKDIRTGRAVIKHEKRVHASNIAQSQLMEKYKIKMSGEIKKLQVEAIDTWKRARAAAAAEAGSIPGHIRLEGSFQGN